MYKVIWLRRALIGLDTLFMAEDAATQNRLVEIVHDLNQRLAQAPHDEGESRGPGLRIAFPELLLVHFQIDEPNKSVNVTVVKRYGK